MKRFEVIRGIIEATSPERDILIFANGRISREACFLADRENHFYMLASMGHAPMIGLGVALALSDRRVIVIDGDGNLLMNLGGLANVVGASPENLLHVVLDNRIYGTTGGQESLSKVVDLAAVARAVGYRTTRRAEGRPSEALGIFNALLSERGPSFLLVRVDADDHPEAPPPRIEPARIGERFRAHLACDRRERS